VCKNIAKIAVFLLAMVAGSQIASADVCWKASYGRGVGSIPSNCDPTGLVKSGLLCYEKPSKPGWFVVAGIAQPSCPKGFRDDGLFCFKPEPYGRGAGYPLWDKGKCENEQPKIESCVRVGTNWMIKCYPGFKEHADGKCEPLGCPEGTKAIPGKNDQCTRLSSARCPPGFPGMGATCLMATYNRKVYSPNEKDKCENDNKTERCEQSGALHYPKCRPGFHAFGCCVCTPDCPADTSDAGISCAKSTYVTRPISASCDSQQQYDAGLCYKQCNTGFYGIGPVCWGQCPKGMVDCGAMCGSSPGECAEAIGDMILSVGKVVANIAETVITFGATTSINAAAEAALDSAASAMKSVAKSAAKQFAGLAKSQIQAKVAGQLKDKNLPPAIADKLADMEANPDNFDYISFIKGLDPTGIVKVVDAFNKRICETDSTGAPTPPSRVLAPENPRASGPNPCAKMLANPKYEIFPLVPGAKYTDNILSERGWTEGRNVLADATGISASVTSSWPKHDLFRALMMNCTLYTKDPNYSNLTGTPADKWSAAQRNQAITLVQRATNMETTTLSGLKNPELMSLLRGK